MIKPEQLGYYILSAIAISVLSLVLSIVSLRQEVGRYQLFVTDSPGLTYVFDTKTSRLFLRDATDANIYRLLRSASAEKKITYWDLGTVNQPFLPRKVTPNVPDGFTLEE
ncbi:MAG: hypothetical protein ACYS4T_18205 [Planctomycetota bacterium]|jgi:hypothetical protein